jgi:hypothetical protein
MAKVIDNPFRAYPFPPARLPFELDFHVFSQPVRRAAALSLETGESNLIVEKRFIRDAISVDVELFFPSPQSQIKFLIIPRECLISSFSSLCALLSLPVDAEK